MNRIIFILFLVLLRLPARSEDATHKVFSDVVSSQEFVGLVESLSKKVDLFRDAWAIDGDAVFFGGTSRDFIYWVKGKFKDAKTRQEAAAIISQLMERGKIETREFISGESDIDVVAKTKLPLDPLKYGVTKIDPIGAGRLDPATAQGQDEIRQGYIPVEKILLGKKGLVNMPQFGDGLGEIYAGAPTVHFSSPDEFAQTYFAQQNLNHPVLLAIRYLRILAVNYFREHGGGYPDETALFNIDRASQERTLQVIASSFSSKELRICLENQKFAGWMNQSIQKAFRANTNQTATKLLFDKFKMSLLVENLSAIQPINQYLFSKLRDPVLISRHLSEFGIETDEFYEPVSAHVSDGTLYHGTKEEVWFRSILLQGALPSDAARSAGSGLYAVDGENMKIAKSYANENEDMIVRFQVSPHAKLVDVTKGHGAEVMKRFFQKYGANKFDGFADYFGIDILKYPYSPHAFVVKNGSVLLRARGYKRQILTWWQLTERFQEVTELSEGIELLSNAYFNQYPSNEIRDLIKKVDEPTLQKKLHSAAEMIDQFDPADRSLVAQLYVRAHNRGISLGAVSNSMRAFPAKVRMRANYLLNLLLSAKNDFESLAVRLGKDLEGLTPPAQAGALEITILAAELAADLQTMGEQDKAIIQKSQALIDYLWSMTVDLASYQNGPCISSNGADMDLNELRYAASLTRMADLLMQVSGNQGVKINALLARRTPQYTSKLSYVVLSDAFRSWSRVFWAGKKNLWPLFTVLPMAFGISLTNPSSHGHLATLLLYAEFASMYLGGYAAYSLFKTTAMSAYFSGRSFDRIKQEALRFILDAAQKLNSQGVGANCIYQMETLSGV